MAEVTKIFGGDLAEEEKRIDANQVEGEEEIGERGPCVQQGESKSHVWENHDFVNG